MDVSVSRIDSVGDTVEFWFSERRDVSAASHCVVAVTPLPERAVWQFIQREKARRDCRGPVGSNSTARDYLFGGRDSALRISRSLNQFRSA
jgi:hypothetical protein